MREILFRAKRKDNDEWVEGYVGRVKILSPSTGKWEEHTVIFNENDYYDVDPNTVGQFTGLKDRNGKKIFEGDIVIGDISVYYRILCVEFFDGAFVVKTRGNHIKAPLYHYCHMLEVLGNIHDNPELLEVDV